ARDPDAYSGGYTLDSAPYAITGQDKLSFADEHSRWFVSFGRLEYAYSKDNERLNYDGRLVWGRDYNKAILTSEGKVDNSKLREASTELLWSHAVDIFWDGQIGVRYDSGDEKDQTWLTAGFQGLAPYWFEIDAKASVSTEGQTALDIEAEYELLLTQRLILQPRLEMSIYGKDDAERGIASGFSSLATGLRLRYEFNRQFAPYVGVEWESKLGDTRFWF
ncbi:MAG: copper resistance protein B, partial [Porticoccus sp.]